MKRKQNEKNRLWDRLLSEKIRKQRLYRFSAVGLCVVLSLPVFGRSFGEVDVQANAFSQDNYDPMSKTLLSNFSGNVIRLSSTYEEKLKAAQDAKKDLENKKQETQQKIAELEKQKSDILTYIEELDKQLNEIMLEVERLQTEITSTKKELKQTQEDLEVAKKTEEKQYETMKKRIQYMYENGSTNLLETLFNSEGLDDFLNQVEYAKKISEYDNNLFKEFKETKELIADQEAALTAQLEELKALEESAEFEQQTTEKLVAQKSEEIEKYTQAIGVSDELLANYSQEITQQEMSIEEIKADEEERIKEEQRRAKEEAERLQREEEERKKKEEAEKNDQSASVGNNADNVEQSGETSINNMIWPLPGDHSVFTGFGYRKAPTTGASTYHRGVDIGGQQGASIVAVLAGTVEISAYSPSSGNYVIINHGNGVRTAYCHCSKLMVSAGEKVNQGQVVGLVGSTGISTAPHLHFGVSINNVYVDPQPYLGY